MTILRSKGCEIYDYPCSHDPEEKKYYYLFYKPAEWEAGKVYIKGIDVVIPATANGFMYECISSGTSSDIAPTYATVENDTIIDNTVVWKAKPYDALLGAGDVINSSVWTTDDVQTVVEDQTLVDNSVTGCQLTGVPVSVTEVLITNTIVVTKDETNQWEYQRSLRIPVAEH